MDMMQKRARHKRFWQPLAKGEGGYLSVMSPINDTGIAPYPLRDPKDVEERWISTEYCLERAEANAQNTYYGQDAIHSEFVNFGPGVHAAMLGAPYVLQPTSIWFDMQPPIKNWDAMPAFETDVTHPLYRAIEDHTRALCNASKGRYAVSYTDIGGQMDVLFSLRGEELLSDLIEYPDEILRAQTKLDDAFLSYFKTLTEWIGPTGCGYTGWIPIANDVPWYPIQCDMSVMISARMFEKFVLPSLDKVSTAIGQSIYHLDGPGEIQHLDMLLSLSHVHAIQWVPLPHANYTDQKKDRKFYFQDFADAQSLDIYRRTLAAGKKVVLLGVNPRQVADIYNAIGCDGVYIQTHCPTRKEADELIDHARKNWLAL